MAKGSPSTICENFYRCLTGEETRNFYQGQLYTTPILIPRHDSPLVLDLEDYDPKQEGDFSFPIRQLSDVKASHQPIKFLKLHYDEYLFVQPGKRRPCVVLHELETDWFFEKEGYVLVAPIFAFKPRHTQEFIINAQIFQYPNLFYLPPDPDGQTEESAIRFELIQPVSKKSCLTYRGGSDFPLALAHDATMLLLNQLAWFLFDKSLDKDLDELVALYRTELQRNIEEARLRNQQ